MANQSELYIGLMSGTSIDGIDVALVDLANSECKLVHSYNHPIDNHVKGKLSELSSPLIHLSDTPQNRIELLARLDVIVGQIFAEAVNKLIDTHQLDRHSICAIGSHGQTVRHRPDIKYPFTLQIGDANVIAEKTGIKVVSDFRRADVAAGGQGAPLAPAFHNAILRHESENRIILNLGGISNITYLPKDHNQRVIGFDTGTANTLLDAWFNKHHPKDNDDFDRDSKFAMQGQVNQQLLDRLLDDPYFQLSYPKSTGREYFSPDWLNKHLSESNNLPTTADVQRTLVQFTVKTIADSIQSLVIKDLTILVCGGGMHNRFLLKLLSKALNISLSTTNEIGVNGDYLEAMTFAWLAKQRLDERPGNLPSVTGAAQLKILGGVYLP